MGWGHWKTMASLISMLTEAGAGAGAGAGARARSGIIWFTLITASILFFVEVIIIIWWVGVCVCV